MAGVRKKREGNLGARPRARMKGGEERVLLGSSFLPRPSYFSRAQSPLSLSFGKSARISSKQWETNGKFFLVTMRLLSNLPITLIALIFVTFLSCQCS